MMIEEFQDQNRWLSNFEPVEITLDGVVYPSVEHAYQSAKSSDPGWKKKCSSLENSAGEIKRIGKQCPELINDWYIKKVEIMQICLKQKFNQEPFKSYLENTGDQNIQEGNNWGDRFWGICLKTGIGENHLGRIIMDIRNDILKKRYCCVCGEDITNTGNGLFCKKCSKPIKNNHEEKKV